MVSGDLWQIYGEATVSTHHYSDLGSRLEAVTIADFIRAAHNEDALQSAKTWMMAETRPNLVIVGPIGCGKSYLAACLYNSMVRTRVSTVWINVASLMAQIKRGFTDKEVAHAANLRVQVAESAAVLFLDDLGKVHPGKDVSFTEETFYAIIDARYRDELPTVVTTEWQAKALAERVGESVVSRLMHGALVAGIKPPAEPYRKRAVLGGCQPATRVTA